MDEPDTMSFEDLDSFAELLMGDREEEFAWEREVRLFQFQTWIAFPTREMIAPTVAGRLIATLILDKISDQARTAKELSVALRARDYRELFDGVIGAYGGWTEMGFAGNSGDIFTDRARKRVKTNFEHVAQIVEERIKLARQNDGGKRVRASPARAISNLVQAGRNGPMVQDRSLHQKWQRSRDSAFFMFLVQRCGFNEMLPVDLFEDPLSSLTAVSRKKSRFRKLFGMYRELCHLLPKELIGMRTLNLPDVKPVPITSSLSSAPKR